MGKIIPDKSAESVINVLMDSWILNMFGAPDKILFDNGREFWNNKMKDLCHNFNIRILSTGAYSPWQNGICERNHAQVDQMMVKIMEDQPNISTESALSQAIMAKNMLVNAKGFSPIQIVFGRQPKLPSAIDNSPPARECVSEVEAVRQRLNAVFAARKSFMQVENSKQLTKHVKSNKCLKWMYISWEIVYITSMEEAHIGKAQVKLLEWIIK